MEVLRFLVLLSRSRLLRCLVMLLGASRALSTRKELVLVYEVRGNKGKVF